MPFLNTVILDIVQEFVIPRNEKNVCIGHLNESCEIIEFCKFSVVWMERFECKQFDIFC